MEVLRLLKDDWSKWVTWGCHFLKDMILSPVWLQMCGYLPNFLRGILSFWFLSVRRCQRSFYFTVTLWRDTWVMIQYLLKSLNISLRFFRKQITKPVSITNLVTCIEHLSEFQKWIFPDNGSLASKILDWKYTSSSTICSFSPAVLLLFGPDKPWFYSSFFIFK